MVLGSRQLPPQAAGHRKTRRLDLSNRRVRAFGYEESSTRRRFFLFCRRAERSLIILSHVETHFMVLFFPKTDMDRFFRTSAGAITTADALGAIGSNRRVYAHFASLLASAAVDTFLAIYMQPV